MLVDRKLPRLAYIGDVPVESSYHGSLLLYRLFSAYPADKLLIVETDLARSSPERRLPSVEYRAMAVPVSRLMRSRFSKIYSIWVFLSARFRARKAMRLIKDFHPEAIISVAHGFHWITAACLAKQLGVPLHLIVHDHVPEVTTLPVFIRPMLERAFRKIYRAAKNRFCVSPYMEAEYSKRYGVAGTVLYPSRAADCPTWAVPPKRSDSQTLRIAFAGTINSGATARVLRLLAECLRPSDKIVVFGPHNDESLKRWKLDAATVKCGGLLSPPGLLVQLRSDFDLLYLPVPFDVPGCDQNAHLNFPSKLADYTSTGLPILVCGPEYSSAVRWAKENAPVAEVVTSQDPSSLREAMERLRSPQHREMLGRRAREIGEKFFSHAAAKSTFLGVLGNASSRAR